MPDNVRCNVDSPQRHIPLSAVSVNDYSATLRACKLSPDVLLGVCGGRRVSVRCCMCCLVVAAVLSLWWYRCGFACDGAFAGEL